MPPKSKQRRPSQARSVETVDAILEAAVQILRAEGLEGAGTTAIAARAGVSVGTLYQYFANKEAVFDALIDGVLARRAAERAEILGRTLSPGDLAPAISALIDELMALHSRDPRLHQQLLRYELARGQSRLEAYEAGMRALVEHQLVTHGKRMRPLDPPLAARVLVHAVLGVAERMAREDPALLARPDVRAELTTLVVGYLAP